MSDKVQVGVLITGKQERDAIHVAVAPVTAAERMSPCACIGFVGDDMETVSTKAEKTIGIVDPFLKKPVNPGERFFMFLYPNTITSLRHDWTHPAFVKQQKEGFSESRQWLIDFIEKRHVEGYPLYTDYNQLIDSIMCGEGMFIASGDELHSANDLDPGEEREFWHHIKVVTGLDLSDDAKASFTWSCSC